MQSGPSAGMKPQDAVREFHEVFGLSVRDELTLPPDAERRLRLELQVEETEELVHAMRAGDVVAVADALADIVYVAYGTAHVFGIDLDAVVAEVHRSNMTKVGEDGPIYREDGKVMKGPDYSPPDIAGVLNGEA